VELPGYGPAYRRSPLLVLIIGSRQHRGAATAPKTGRWAREFFITVPQRRRLGPAGGRGSCSSPWRGAGAQSRPVGAGVVHHRGAAPAPRAGRWSRELFITVARRRRPKPAGGRGSSSSPCSAGAQGRSAGVGVVHHGAAMAVPTARAGRQVWEFFITVARRQRPGLAATPENCSSLAQGAADASRNPTWDWQRRYRTRTVSARTLSNTIT